MKKAVGEEQAEIAEVYGEVEKNAHFLVESADVPAQTFSADDTKNLVSLLNILHCGVFAMNQLLPKLPDLSVQVLLQELQLRSELTELQPFHG